MGGIILVFLLTIVILILITPAMRARGRKEREHVQQSAHEAVVSRLEDHRRRRKQSEDEAGNAQ